MHCVIYVKAWKPNSHYSPIYYLNTGTYWYTEIHGPNKTPNS